MVSGTCMLLVMVLLTHALASEQLQSVSLTPETSLPDHLSLRLYYSLLLPCTVPLGLAAVVWNWLSFKLFKHSVSPWLASSPRP